jgi:NAD-dependent SIR2 family protein deacetylase
MNSSIVQIADALESADALVIAAGAGMGVDSGLPDFRGGAGFWQAYPPFAKLGLRFEQLAYPRWFRDDPALAWGFYGHRLLGVPNRATACGVTASKSDYLRKWSILRRPRFAAP